MAQIFFTNPVKENILEHHIITIHELIVLPLFEISTHRALQEVKPT